MSDTRIDALIFDSDGLIKLARAGVVHAIPSECLISEEVYKEVVVAGKRLGYADALEIERFIQNKKLKVKPTQPSLFHHGLGEGERSALMLFKQVKASAIISDDRRFLSILEEENIPFMIPTECIVALVKTKRLTVREGIEALAKIREYVRKSSHDYAKDALGDERL